MLIWLYNVPLQACVPRYAHLSCSSPDPCMSCNSSNSEFHILLGLKCEFVPGASHKISGDGVKAVLKLYWYKIVTILSAVPFMYGSVTILMGHFVFLSSCGWQLHTNFYLRNHRCEESVLVFVVPMINVQCLWGSMTIQLRCLCMPGIVLDNGMSSSCVLHVWGSYL